MTRGGRGRWGVRTVVALAFVEVLLLGACSNDKPEGQPTPTSSTPTAPGTPSPSPTTSPSPTVAPTARARLIVYEDTRPGANQSELFLYTVATDSVKKLTNTANRAHDPRFIDGDRISYLETQTNTTGQSRTSIMELRLDTGATSRIMRTALGTSIVAHSWSPERTTIAYWLAATNNYEVHLYVRASKSDRRVKSFPRDAGRGIGESDEVEVSWALDGRALLSVNTFVDSGPTMHLLRATGANVIAPRAGTYARYTRDGNRIFYREFSLSRSGGRWFAVTAPGDVGSSLGIRPATVRPDLSPDGTMIAVDDATNEQVNPSVWIYAFSTNASRRLANGVAPLWLTADSVAISNTVRCASPDDGVGCEAGWRQTGTVNRRTLSGGSKRLKLVTTLNAAVLYQ